MTTPKTTFAGLALIAARCTGSTLGLTACTDEKGRAPGRRPRERMASAAARVPSLVILVWGNRRTT